MYIADIHPDIARYLEYDCYCPDEIYDMTGFSYMLFGIDDECAVIEANEERTAIIAFTSHGRELDNPQAIMFWHDDENEPGHVIAAQRVDATENNIGILRSIVLGEEPDGRQIDEFNPGEMARDMDRLMSLCNGFVIRD